MRHSHPFLSQKSSEEVAKAIQKAARSSYRLPKTVNDSVNQVLSISISSIKALESQIKKFDKAIAEQMEPVPNTLTSIKGIGVVYSAGIIAEISDINRFYHLKYNEVNKYRHKRALALTARKFVRPVFRLLKDNRLYIAPEA